MMSLKRIQVKAELILSRAFEHSGAMGPTPCDLCGSNRATDLHELILERDDVKGAKQMTTITETEENLQLLCRNCNMIEAKKTGNRDKLISRQIMRYGRLEAKRMNSITLSNELYIELGAAQLQRFVRSVGLKYPGQYLLRIHNLAQGMLTALITGE